MLHCWSCSRTSTALRTSGSTHTAANRRCCVMQSTVPVVSSSNFARTDPTSLQHTHSSTFGIIEHRPQTHHPPSLVLRDSNSFPPPSFPPFGKSDFCIFPFLAQNHTQLHNSYSPPYWLSRQHQHRIYIKLWLSCGTLRSSFRPTSISVFNRNV